VSEVTYEYEFVDGPFDLVVTMKGLATADGIEEGQARLFADTRFHLGLTTLIDLSELDVATMPTAELRVVAERSGRRFAGIHRIAYVAPEPVVFGMLRMFRALAPEPFADRTTVVRSRDAALQWLEETP
jgi:hypothetical protein